MATPNPPHPVYDLLETAMTATEQALTEARAARAILDLYEARTVTIDGEEITVLVVKKDG